MTFTFDFWQGVAVGIAVMTLFHFGVVVVVHYRAKRHNARIDKAIDGLDKLGVNAP